ncbi:hypothetical protein [Bacillus sp. FJAT-50079]|uniref:hypothetical protein n=1 Tax=Bacillus sp. FJAT-50079 TaxID=2833577 RepID=UPI001BC8F53C|nr:hypothetical protein [Bacillus sp. FJAT-50079]MBS4210696.1 hypothetical protein [Bacillus sp. FJAT-50079]
MKGIITVIFFLAALLLAGMLHYVASQRRPGIYPPKKILKQRAMTLGGAGFICLVIGVLIALSIK